MKLRFFLAFCLLAIMVTSGSALALAPADLSAIGDFRAFTQNIDSSAKRNNLNLAFEELEIAIQGYLNPFAVGNAIVTSSGDNFEIEEASATIVRGLPWNLNIKVGKYLVDFGKLNQEHPHAWSFVDRPLVYRMLIGADGLNDVGFDLSTLLPVGFYSKLSLNVLSGKSLEFDGLDRGTQRPIAVGRLNAFLPVGEFGNVDVGVSGLRGIYLGSNSPLSGGHSLNATMVNIDFKYKYRPSDYTAVVVQGEWLWNRRDILNSAGTGSVSNHGGYGYVDWRFLKRYNAGGMIDYAPGVFDYEAGDTYDTGPSVGNNTPLGRFDNKNSTLALTGFAGFALVEETTLIRLYGRYMKFNIHDSSLLANPNETSKKSQFLVGLQVIFSMGPHKPHQF